MKHTPAFALLLCCYTSAIAGTYWVSPTGAAIWENCASASPLTGSSACPIATANTNAAAGDLVYLRAGTYSINMSIGAAINPSHTGTLGARIIFAAYAGETPAFEQANTTNQSYGANLNGKSYMVIDGITFHNFQLNGVVLTGGASNNEISHNSFINDASFAWGSRVIELGGSDSPWSTHNWIHHNYISRRYSNSSSSNPCNEGIDLIRVGQDQASPFSADNYNTVENNYFEYGSHSTLAVYGKYNTVNNNISHNDPWVTGCTSYDGSMPNLNGDIRGSTSTSSVTIGTGSKSFTVATGLSATFWTSGQILSMFRTSDPAQAMFGSTTSYNGTTGALVVNVSKVAAGASGTYADWTISNQNAPIYADASYNGLYGHRVFLIGDEDLANPSYNLVEGNRLGFAGVNPNNDGADNLDLGTPKNIARYNFIYGSMGAGIYFKWANGGAQTGGVLNHVYNNTVYGNGTWDSLIYGGLNNGYASQGITQYSGAGQGGGSTNNVIKNNIVYSNGGGDICYSNQLNPSCSPWGGDTVVSNLTGTDPKFVAPAMTDPLSQNLFAAVHGYSATPIPNLSLQASSPAIDGGTYLTQAVGSDTGSTTLVVGDALYFQDGTWGSDLARGVTLFRDWIAIGTVGNVVQISSINYSTNTITLASPMTWADGAGIWLYKKSDGAVVLQGAAPDLGASEYVPPVTGSVLFGTFSGTAK